MAHDLEEKQEFEAVLAEWDAFAREVKMRAKQLGKAQADRVRKPLPKKEPVKQAAAMDKISSG